MVNNTIVDNSVGIRVDARVETAGQVYRNNILTGNQVGLQVDFGAESRNPTWQNNLVFGNQSNYTGIADQTGQAGNLSFDPGFVNGEQDDFHLQPGSPAVDTGSNEGAPGVDFDGNPRPFDGDADGTATTDIGAYESQSANPIPPPGNDDFVNASIVASLPFSTTVDLRTATPRQHRCGSASSAVAAGPSPPRPVRLIAAATPAQHAVPPPAAPPQNAPGAGGRRRCLPTWGDGSIGGADG